MISQILKKLVLALIRLYQKTLSPDTGWFAYRHPYGYCRFVPTCSEYAYQSIQRHGLLRGMLYALQRLLKCHPWHPSGYDPIP